MSSRLHQEVFSQLPLRTRRESKNDDFDSVTAEIGQSFGQFDAQLLAAEKELELQRAIQNDAFVVGSESAQVPNFQDAERPSEDVAHSSHAGNFAADGVGLPVSLEENCHEQSENRKTAD